MKYKHQHLNRWRWIIIVTLCLIFLLGLVSSSWVWWGTINQQTQDPSQVMLVEDTP